MPEISVIVPVYNVEKYLKRCVDSILNQTFTDFELILVDDGSTDNSPEMCDECAELDKRVKIIHQSNCGQASARNRALDICCGEYVAFVDSDDYVSPKMLEVLYSNSVACDADISICEKILGCSRSHEFSNLLSEVSVHNGKDFLKRCLFENIDKCWILCDKLFKKSCFAAIRLPEGRVYEDNATVYKLLYNAKRVADCDTVLYYYFTNPQSTVHQKNLIKQLDWLLALKEMSEFFKINDENDLYELINKRYLSCMYTYCYKAEEVNDKRFIKSLKLQWQDFSKAHKDDYNINMDNYPYAYKVFYPFYYSLRNYLVRIKNYIGRRI